MKEYHVLVRPAVSAGFLGYTLFILILLFDLGWAFGMTGMKQSHQAGLKGKEGQF